MDSTGLLSRGHIGKTTETLGAASGEQPASALRFRLGVGRMIRDVDRLPEGVKLLPRDSRFVDGLNKRGNAPTILAGDALSECKDGLLSARIVSKPTGEKSRGNAYALGGIGPGYANRDVRHQFRQRPVGPIRRKKAS